MTNYSKITIEANKAVTNEPIFRAIAQALQDAECDKNSQLDPVLLTCASANAGHKTVLALCQSMSSPGGEGREHFLAQAAAYKSIVHELMDRGLVAGVEAMKINQLQEAD